MNYFFAKKDIYFAQCNLYLRKLKKNYHIKRVM